MIKENIQRVRDRINAVCSKVKIDADKISVICVTKGRRVEQVQEAVNLGLKFIGENKVQEAAEKYQQVSGAQWQMVGHLQSNKVKDAVKIFGLIHSVDTASLAREINKQAAKINKIQEVLLEVKVSGEASKFGFDPGALAAAYKEIKNLKNIKIKGLMTIAPLSASFEEARPYFSKLRRLRDAVNGDWLLSMGMSDDFEIAIEEGADMIRLGRVIFEG